MHHSLGHLSRTMEHGALEGATGIQRQMPISSLQTEILLHTAGLLSRGTRPESLGTVQQARKALHLKKGVHLA